MLLANIADRASCDDPPHQLEPVGPGTKVSMPLSHSSNLDRARWVTQLSGLEASPLAIQSTMCSVRADALASCPGLLPGYRWAALRKPGPSDPAWG